MQIAFIAGDVIVFWLSVNLSFRCESLSQLVV